jgi:predicted PolB exonuclease-like 3'-5' exonuclease
MSYKDELKIAVLSYMAGNIEYDELDKRIGEIFSKAVYEELREKGVEIK